MRVPHWDIGDPWKTKTYKNVDLEIKVATLEDVEQLIQSPNVFPKASEGRPGFWPQQLNEYTDFRGLNYPYICIARANGNIVGRLYLDPNSNNSIKRNLHAAIIDSVVVDPEFENNGIADKLIEFAETLAKNNGVRWLEIGAVRDTAHTHSAHSRKGVDAVRSFLRKGFYKQPLYLKKGLAVHYQARDFPATFVLSRYVNGLVLYKDLEKTLALTKEQQDQLFEKLISGMPS